MGEQDAGECPFGEHLAKYWHKLSPMERTMRLDPEGLYSLALQEVALPIARKVAGRTVVDAFCGAGGFTIALARASKRVIAIDRDPARLEMARHNVGLWKVGGRVEFHLGDARDLVPGFKGRCDAILLDPPWGGPDYASLDQFRLRHFEPDGHDLLRVCFPVARQVALRLPKNFATEELDSLGRSYRLEQDYLNGKLMHRMAYFGP